MERGYDRVRRTFDELAAAVAEQVAYDRLCVVLAGGPALACVREERAPAETLVAPLFANGLLIGRLHASRGGAPFSTSERDCLRGAARFVASAAVGMLQTLESEQLLDEAGVLLEIARATASVAEPRAVAVRATEILARLVPAPGQFAIFVGSDDLTSYSVIVSQVNEYPSEVRGLVIPEQELESYSVEAFREGKSVYTPDVLEVPNLHRREMFTKLGLRTLLTVPIRAGGQNLGLLHVSQPQPRQVFPASTRRVLEGVADQLAMALHNARLAKENSRQLEELRAISRRLWSVQEEERRRIARELHDEAGQAMTALKLNLDLARREEETTKVKARIAEAVALAGNVLEELRRIARDLRPASLDDLGLVPAVRALVDGFGARTAIEVAFSHDDSSMPAPDSDAAATIFRFVQEALTNVMRHAQAHRVDVRLKTENGSLSVQVEDDGVGFDAGAVNVAGRLGLLGMKERARLLGGRVILDSGALRGARLSLVIPRERVSTEGRVGERE